MNGSSETPEPAPPPTGEPDPGRRSSPPERRRGWLVRTSQGSARRFHDLDPDADTGHEIRIHRVRRPSVVFGSTQLPNGFMTDDPADGEVVDADGGEVEVCRRRSGGGLVVVRSDDVWIDAIVPRHSRVHTDDVSRAFGWFGRTWLDALDGLWMPATDTQPILHLAEPPSGRRAADRPFFCFADVGHGEVLCGGHKVVGISQRRTRTWTRLQSLFVASWNPAEIDSFTAYALARAGIDGPAGGNRSGLGAPPHDAAGVRAGFPPDGPPFTAPSSAVVDAVLDRLPIVDDTMPPGDEAEPRR